MAERKRKSQDLSRPRRSMFGAAVRWILFIFLLIVIVLLLLIVLQKRITITDTAMYPTLRSGDVVLTDELSYRVRKPARGDVVRFSSRYQEDTVYLRRVIGLPGETVLIVGGSIYINGLLLEKYREFGPVNRAGTASSMLVLGEDEYFVLCDNREVLSDSRETSIGLVKRSEITGKAVLRLLPLSRIGLI